MQIEVITRNELDNVKYELMDIIQRILSDSPLAAQFMKSSEVQGIFKCSSGKLASLRESKKIKFLKVGDVIYYSADSVRELNKSLNPIDDSPW